MLRACESVRREQDLRKKKPYDKSVYRALALITQFGINILAPIAMMCALGIFLDKKLGTSYLTLLLFFVGAIAGAQNNYRMAKKFFTDSSRTGKEEKADAGEASGDIEEKK